MTLDEAIAHAKEVAGRLGASCNCEAGECSVQHQQLAGWLQELKDLRESRAQMETDLPDEHDLNEARIGLRKKMLSAVVAAESGNTAPVDGLVEESEEIGGRLRAALASKLGAESAESLEWFLLLHESALVVASMAYAFTVEAKREIAASIAKDGTGVN